MGRFSAAIVAFATATAFVTSARALPEFFIQLRDPNLLGGNEAAWLVRTFGFPFVMSLCAVIVAAALLLAAWRTRLRGATDWHVGLAAILIALCFMGRIGVSLDPIAWLCAAAICLLLDRDDLWSSAATVALVAFWSLTQGGATAGALIVALSAAGYIIEKRRLDSAVIAKLIAVAACIVISLVQLRSGLFYAYGAHALYLDSLLGGAQRDRLWAGAFTPQNIGFAAIVVIAGWYGIRRRGRAGDALTFFAFLLLSLADARNLPLFGIVAGPVVADALASYYLRKRERPAGSLSAYGVAFAAAACAFVAAVTVMQPKIIAWPRPATMTLLSTLLDQPGEHHILCIQPRWCDSAAFLRSGKISVLLDDRAGTAAPVARKIQRDVAGAIGNWQEDLRRANIDGILADQDNRLVSLLHADGWESTISSGGEILLRKLGKQ